MVSDKTIAEVAGVSKQLAAEGKHAGPTVSCDGRPAPRRVENPKGKLTWEELQALFGDTMPQEAVKVLVHQVDDEPMDREALFKFAREWAEKNAYAKARTLAVTAMHKLIGMNVDRLIGEVEIREVMEPLYKELEGRSL